MIFNLTTGEIFFYGGIIGMAVVAVVSIIFIAVLANGKKRLKRKFEFETKNIKK